MGTLALSGVDKSEVRLQIGRWVTPDILTDEQIESRTILGEASDYVFEKVREGMNLDAFTDEQRAIAERFYDETVDDIVGFITVVLKPPQELQMRRAVIYRCAGIGVPIVDDARRDSSRSLEAESIGVISQRYISPVLGSQRGHSERPTQAKLFDLADDSIRRLRDAFPTDAFSAPRLKIKMFSIVGR